MTEPVFVLGVGRTDFQRNFKKEGGTLRHMIVEAGKALKVEIHDHLVVGRDGVASFRALGLL